MCSLAVETAAKPLTLKPHKVIICHHSKVESCSRSLATHLTCFSAPHREAHTGCMPPVGYWGHLADLRMVFTLHIPPPFTWCQEQIIFRCPVPRLQGQSLSTVFFLLFQDAQEVTDRWGSPDLQICKAVRSLFLLKRAPPQQDLPSLCSHSPCNAVNWLWRVFPWNTVDFLN